jgi:hypothetical protein
LVEYLIPPKNNATTQGKHVLFDIDVKGGEKEWCECYSWRIVQPSGLPSMPKGGYCWHVYRQSMLVIDGKNNNDAGMITGRVCLSLMARSECASMEKHEQCKLM